MGHDNEWTVATLKAYFDALRTEDQRAISLLGNEVRLRLDTMAVSFDRLKESVDQFHSSISGQEKRGNRDTLVIFNIITVISTIGLIAVNIFHSLR